MSDTARLEALEARCASIERQVKQHGAELERLRTILVSMGVLAGEAKL